MTARTSIRTKSAASESSQAGRIALWTGKGVVALIFLATGSAKILGAPQLVRGFEQIGLGQWFRYFTGALEILGALLLLWPAASGLGALILLGISVGAIFVQAFFMHGDVVHTLILSAANAGLVWANRRQLLGFLRPAS
jgi:putative oxidoreductase